MKDSKHLVDISKLVKISTYAALHKISISYVYKLIREEKLEPVEIDGVTFLNKEAKK